MIEQLSDHPDGARLDARTCVIGAGAAGLTVARRLAALGHDVLVLESGGLALDPDTQALYEGDADGPLDYPLASTRMRFFGGSTNCWTGFCMPLDEEDFSRRAWIPESGWPISLEDVLPFYRGAQGELGLGDFLYRRSPRMTTREPFLDLDREKLRYRFWQISGPARFNVEHRDAVAGSARIRMVFGANVTALRLGSDGRRVTEARVRGLDGRTLTVAADRFVLALGGIENARLLLASNEQRPAGLGNGSGRVGRYFMEHPLLATARFFPTRYTGWLHANQDIGVPGGGHATAGIGPSRALQRGEEILDAVMTISEGRRDPDAGYMTLARLRRAWEAGEWPEDLGSEIWKVVSDLDDVWAGVRANVTGEHYDAIASEDGALTVNTHLEQAPAAESAITLSEERDALGMPRVHLRWRLGELERRTIVACNRALGEELGRLGLGRVRLDDWVLDPGASWPGLGIKCHHMGTTRMSAGPADGVVDANARLHDVPNVWVAGSSIFPTGGVANPTLTIVALSLRLADHLAADPASPA